MSAPETVSDPELQEVAWDLSDLLNGAGDDPQAGVDALLAEAQRRADTFAEQHAGKLADIDGAGLVAAMRELAEIEEVAARAGTYAHLAFSVDTQSPANGALLQRVEEKGTAIETDDWNDFLRDHLQRDSHGRLVRSENGSFIEKGTGNEVYFGQVGTQNYYITWPVKSETKPAAQAGGETDKTTTANTSATQQPAADSNTDETKSS